MRCGFERNNIGNEYDQRQNSRHQGDTSNNGGDRQRPLWSALEWQALHPLL